MATTKAKLYRVSFSWGPDYNSKVNGLVSCEVNVSEAMDKFDALKKAFDLVSPLVDGVEPSKMSATTRDND